MKWARTMWRAVHATGWLSLAALGAGCSGRDATLLDRGGETTSGGPSDVLNAASNDTVPSAPFGTLGAALDAADANIAHGGLTLAWEACADGFECTTALLPASYAEPHGARVGIAVTRLPARDASRRIGSLFVNFGGPGGDAVGALHDFGRDLFATLNERFDIVGFDPRGTGASDGAIDCHVDQEEVGVYATPSTTPLNLDVPAWLARAQSYVDACVNENPGAFSNVSTADAARDMDALRAAVGDAKLSYVGYSYGSFLGATYAALFPHHYRALVLDGALDADGYIADTLASGRAQTAGFERAFGRFLEACSGNPEACFGFGGNDPHAAFDRMVAEATAEPIVVPGARPLDGDDILAATIIMLYAKQNWSFLAESLAAAENGDPTLLRYLADISYGLLEDGSFDPSLDRFVTLSAAERQFPSDPDVYLDAGLESWNMFEHFFSNSGYSELSFGLFPIRSNDSYAGPFVASASAPTVLVVATTFDPATPYRGSELLVESLGNARLLTMLGDGHTAYGGNSLCIDQAVEAYLEDGTLPDTGTRCTQEVPFELPPEVAEEVASTEGGARASAARFPVRAGRWVRWPSAAIAHASAPKR